MALKRIAQVAQEARKTCIDCDRTIDYLADFPGPRCLDCHARRFDQQVRVTGALPQPDFKKAVKI